MLRRSAGHTAQIVFTADGHELVQGDIGKGACAVRYDPFRIVPKSDFVAPLPISIHMKFHPGNLWITQQMQCQSEQLHTYLADSAGQNVMSVTNFIVPNGANEIECWFSYQSTSNTVLLDNNGGLNYWLRCPLFDLQEISGQLHQDTAGTKQLLIAVTSLTEVEKMVARWRLTKPAGQRQDAMLVAASDDDKKVWRTSEQLLVPTGSAAIFDLVYYVRGHEYTDDNEGTWYVVAD